MLPKKQLIIKAIYTGAFRFPDKDAASQRVLGIAKAIRNAGGEVVFCGWEKGPREEDKTDTGYVFQGFKYFPQAELDKKNGNLYTKLFSYLTLGNNTIRWIKQYLETNDVAHIISYHGTSIFLYRLYRLCKRNNVKLIGDCTEIYKYDQLPGGFYGLPNIDNNIRIRIIYPLIKNIIVISSYLKNTLDKKGCNTIIVPPLVDLEELKWNFSNDVIDLPSSYKRRLIYAGNPGKKDLIKPILDALKLLNTDAKLFELLLVGVSMEKFRKEYLIEKYKDLEFVRCVGRVNIQDVPKYYHLSDFSIIIRYNEEYANAGFPTKLVESFSCGVPVIANKTSDIGSYISTDVNGVLLSDPSLKSITQGLIKIINYSDEQIIKMKHNAYDTAHENFNYSNYSNRISQYLKVNNKHNL